MADGFLGRWSRRKEAVRKGEPVEPEKVAAAVPASEPVPQPLGGARPDEASPLPESGVAPEQPPPPTVADTEFLTPASDFSRFVRPDVAPEVKNAALKKLFADPHFNVMDGLDVYIDDYGKPDPLPESVVRQLASVQFLGLFREEERKDEPAGGPREDEDGATRASVAQSGEDQAADESSRPPPQAGPDHGHADLRLQPDDAPGPPGPGAGSG